LYWASPRPEGHAGPVPYPGGAVDPPPGNWYNTPPGTSGAFGRAGPLFGPRPAAPPVPDAAA